ncbi:MAG: KH domain-containing protein [Candidatus Cloacimonetes bacterium]|nr:KH domain-containing protein [Candidatus Cloacimonadota bacterium]
MREIIKEGKSTSAIISEFMNEFKLKLDDFKFEVIEQSSHKFLNLFSSKLTKIKFIMPDVSEKIKEFTDGILSKMNVEYSSVKVDFEENIYNVSVGGAKDPGFIIGKEAKLLDSLQHLLNQMINKSEKKKLKVHIDVDGYRQRRKDALIEKVRNIAEQVKRNSKSVTMEPLHAANRRIIHQFVEKDEYLNTMTIGEGDFKRVVILPASKIKERSRKTKSPKSR